MDGWGGWGSDLGLAPAAYLSEKCLNFPDQTEVSAIDYHIKNFLLGYLVNARDPYGQRTFQFIDGSTGTTESLVILESGAHTTTRTLPMFSIICTGLPKVTPAL